MAQTTDILDLGRFALSSGEARHVDLTVRLAPVELAGQRYAADPTSIPVRLDVARMVGGYSLRLRYSIRLAGPCMRCLEDAGRSIEVDVREVDHPGGGSEELVSPYVQGDELDLAAWTRDALVLELPTQIVCSEDCKGICAVCGENLNTAGPDHHHEKPRDPRWAKLSELRLD
jgi:DUF177 domain-containing protein